MTESLHLVTMNIPQAADIVRDTIPAEASFIALDEPEIIITSLMDAPDRYAISKQLLASLGMQAIFVTETLHIFKDTMGWEVMSSADCGAMAYELLCLQPGIPCSELEPAIKEVHQHLMERQITLSGYVSNPISVKSDYYYRSRPPGVVYPRDKPEGLQQRVAEFREYFHNCTTPRWQQLALAMGKPRVRYSDGLQYANGAGLSQAWWSTSMVVDSIALDSERGYVVPLRDTADVILFDHQRIADACQKKPWAAMMSAISGVRKLGKTTAINFDGLVEYLMNAPATKKARTTDTSPLAHEAFDRAKNWAENPLWDGSPIPPLFTASAMPRAFTTPAVEEVISQQGYWIDTSRNRKKHKGYPHV